MFMGSPNGSLCFGFQTRISKVHSSGINGGRNMVNDNIFVDCATPLKMNNFAPSRVYDAQLQERWNAVAARFRGKLDRTPWHKYPVFREFLTYKTEKEFRYPITTAERNLVANIQVERHRQAQTPCGMDPGKYGQLQAANYWVTNQDPGFRDYARGNFTLDRRSPVFDKIKGFQPGEFAKMGRVAFVHSTSPRGALLLSPPGKAQ
jgi:hypothetical protein